MTHIAVFLSNKIDKVDWLKRLANGQLKGIPPLFFQGKGLLFSAITLNNFMHDEARFGLADLQGTNRQCISQLSSGEQKKLLLQFLLLQQPRFIILDDPFDNLDTATKESLGSELQKLSSKISFLQLLDRREDLLPFIDKLLLWTNNELVALNNWHDELFQESLSANTVQASIPPPPIEYQISDEALVVFKKVSISYDDRPIVKNIDWQIRKGEFWQLKGPNGSGKTTLVTLITGDNPKAYGQNITLFGRLKGTGESIWDIREKVGYFTPAMANLFSRYQSIEQMILGGFFDSIGLYQRPSEWQVKLAAEWMRLIDLYPQRHQAFYTLSLGLQRLVLIARAMVKLPPLLILDEPTAGLDDQNAAILGQLVQKIADEKKTAILLVSHRIEKWMNPTCIFELKTDVGGSVGVVTKMA